MAIIAATSKTIVDLSDGKSLSVYLNSTMPKQQIYDSDSLAYKPDWTDTNLVITPAVYVNQAAIALSDTHLIISWQRREGTGSAANLTTGETVSGKVLTVNANKLAGLTSAQITYICTVRYDDPETGVSINAVDDITYSLITTGASAKTVWISGEQVFKYNASGAVSPSQITVTANLQGVVMSKWQYKNADGEWVEYPTTSDNATITNTSLVVKPGHPEIWVNDMATIRVVTTDDNVSDVISIYKIADGKNGTNGGAGAPASVVFLTNENITFAGNTSGQVAATTVSCNVVAYTGTSKVTPTVGAINCDVKGMTVAKGEVVNSEIPITITIVSGATLGGADAQQGSLIVPVTDPVSTELTISWSKVNTGATGSPGVNGSNAIVMSLYAPDGTVFTNESGSKDVVVSAYDGPNEITTGSYSWERYASGTWTEIAGQTSGTLKVDGSSVAGVASFRCNMTYNGKVYSDVITLTLTLSGDAGVYGSTIRSVFISGGGYSSNSRTLTTNPLQTFGNITFTATVTDSRGRSSSTTATRYVQPYSPVSIASAVARRADGNYAASGDGTNLYGSVTFAKTEVPGAGVTIITDYKISTASAYTALTSSTLAYNDATRSCEIKQAGLLATDASYNVRYTVTDGITSTTYEMIVPTASVYAVFDKDSKTVGFGSYPDTRSTTNNFTVASDWNLYTHGSEILELIKSQAGSLGYQTADQAYAQAINAIRDRVYPVGSIYMSATNPESPAAIWGGYWTRLDNLFLVGAGTLYAARTSGGEASHVLSINEMPSHNHSIKQYTTGGTVEWGLENISNKTQAWGWDRIGYTGGNQAHNNIPPYFAVYIWLRTA